MPLNKSVHSGDFSGGSQSSKVKDIENDNIGIAMDFNNFKKKEKTDRPNYTTDNMRKYSIKEEMIEEDETVKPPMVHPAT
jgi:hypothetical protein